MSCPEGCCDSSAGLVLEGGMFMLLNNQATTQSKSHQLVARESCNIYNKFAVTPKNCAAEVKPFDLTKPDASWFDDKGKCKSSAPPECKMISLVPGSSIYASKQINCKKNTENPCDQDFYSTYKSNPDGSITVKTSGKPVNLSIDSFKNINSLTKAGVPSELAESLLSQFGKIKKDILGNSKIELASLNSSFMKKEDPKSLNSEQVLDQMNSTHVNVYDTPVEKRIPAENLTRNFNGEPIHVSTSNIFEIMASRYKKTAATLLP